MTSQDHQHENSFTRKFALTIRGITVPPILVSALLILLYFSGNGMFANINELFVALLFLVIIPLSAYPLSSVIPQIKVKGREGQRKLAFATNLIGYTGSVMYGLIFSIHQTLFLVFLTYFISVIILIVLNKLLHIKASGHACSTAGPLVFLVYFIGPQGIIPCILIVVGVVWSSRYLKRHTLTELLFGALTALLAFAIALFLV